MIFTMLVHEVYVRSIWWFLKINSSRCCEKSKKTEKRWKKFPLRWSSWWFCKKNFLDALNYSVSKMHEKPKRTRPSDLPSKLLALWKTSSSGKFGFRGEQMLSRETTNARRPQRPSNEIVLMQWSNHNTSTWSGLWNQWLRFNAHVVFLVSTHLNLFSQPEQFRFPLKSHPGFLNNKRFPSLSFYKKYFLNPTFNVNHLSRLDYFILSVF